MTTPTPRMFGLGAMPRAAGECKPALLEQHPQLADVDVPDLPDADAYMAYLARLEVTYGTELAVTALPDDGHTHIDPLTELADMMPGKPVIAVVTP
ncbi:hypothetical protein [Mycobacteroides abscessus]|uniref:hypothetical protein n=1 Tax=Mycobacteroides abscessus TaxID=36809 RepID=UPI0009299449|nr:hypothetical protein [Mycobacteroides abscessus]SHY94168.1 Uncharacterised protein [Mycobacteroides abscessus subsp. abscessus]SHZ90389.1 Uncharacterised protein [Mycobacteroides abscessus subsp. abscessus]SHZ90931.1 Uncharacterised protein [Mycobacteroides abscessus subsp. abscessus]SIA63806.1 Uncharacterised protein [Mycobacteroides abscessus subsp. abscessus]SIC37951.1 Uncharacterised protein [Mycobacteroides abscessus subsp. abscessus]